jgi:hypothetical protein
VPALLGYHRRLEGQRLDHLAAAYLKNRPVSGGGATRISRSRPTRWPRELVAVPVKGR